VIESADGRVKTIGAPSPPIIDVTPEAYEPTQR
jgi:hypothetical protein